MKKVFLISSLLFISFSAKSMEKKESEELIDTMKYGISVESLKQKLKNPKIDVNYFYESRSPLMYACKQIEKTIEILKIILEHKANINAQNEKGWSVLRYTIFQNCSHEIIQFLIDNDANLNLATNNGNTPLIYLVYRTQRSIDRLDQFFGQMLKIYYQNTIEFLLEQGADPAIKGKNGKNLFTYAKKPEVRKIVLRILSEHKEKIKQKLQKAISIIALNDIVIGYLIPKE